MTTLTVEIDKERDLPVLKALFGRRGLKYELEENDKDEWRDLSEVEIEGIKAGLADIEAGRLHSHDEVMAYMKNRLNQIRKKWLIF